MLRTFLTTLIATFITSVIAIFLINPGVFSDLKNVLFSSINPANITSTVPTQENLSSDVSSSGSSALVQDLFLDSGDQEKENIEAERLIQEALAHSDYEERYILNGIIEKYNLEIEALFNELDSIERAKQQENIMAILSIINRHIFIWDPYYYFVHPESQTPIAATSTNLKNKHKELMRLLVALDSQETGRIATSYIKFLIEDIAKSGRRNNSDFVRFSYANYQTYRRFFDELASAHTDFDRGFAEEFTTLFNSFYNMHRDVHPGHNSEVRGWLAQLRQELIARDQSVLNELVAQNKATVNELVKSAIAVLEEQKTLRAGQHAEVRAFIEADLDSYKNFSF